MTAAAPASLSATDTGFAAGLRGFGAIGIVGFVVVALGIMVTPPLGAALVLLWAWLSKTPWRDLGLARPRSWIGGLIVGLMLGIGMKFAMKAVVLPLLGAPPVNAAFHNVATDPTAALDLLAYTIYGAGFSEELVYRGFLFERMRRLFGASALATLAILLIATSLFAVAHWQQGLFGIANAFGTGLVIGIVFLVCQRKLFVPMVMHAAFDLTALAMIYYNLETPISHLVFK